MLGVDGLAAALLSVGGLGLPPPLIAGLLPRALSPAIERLGRPLNRPERRLTSLALLVGRGRGELTGLVLNRVASAASARELIEEWQVAEPSGGPALLGRERAQELVLNVVLPFAAGRPELTAKVEEILAQMPVSPAYGKTLFLEANLELADGKRRVKGALAQQGLLAMVEEWCKQGGCGRCPLS